MEYPEARKEAFANLVRFVRKAPAMNCILWSCLDDSNVEDTIRQQINYFRPMEQPFEWIVYDHDEPHDLKARLETFGFVADAPSPILIRDLHADTAALLEARPADVRPITSQVELRDVVHVEQQVWGGDFNWMYERLGLHLSIPNFLNIYVAYVEDEPASTAWVYFYPDGPFAGLWGGSTVEKYRGLGLYKALLAARAQDALRRDYRYLMINAGDMSLPIVRRHGFQLLAYEHAMQWVEGTPDPLR